MQTRIGHARNRCQGQAQGNRMNVRGFSGACHCEFLTGIRADPRWMKPAFIVMAGCVQAIRSGQVPRPMAATSPAMTVKVTRKANQI
jgi:hypothetical protein